MIRVMSRGLDETSCPSEPIQAAAVVVAPVISLQTAKRSAITCRSSGADSRCQRGRKVRPDAAERGQQPLRVPDRREAFHRPLAVPGQPVKVLGGLVRYFDRRCCTDAISSRCATW